MIVDVMLVAIEELFLGHIPNPTVLHPTPKSLHPFQLGSKPGQKFQPPPVSAIGDLQVRHTSGMPRRFPGRKLRGERFLIQA